MKEGGLVKKLKLKFEKKICKDGRRNTENGKQKKCSFFKIDFGNNIQAWNHCINLQNYGFRIKLNNKCSNIYPAL